MDIEIEKKYLVSKEDFKTIETLPRSKLTKNISQFYLSVGDKTVSRVRIIDNKKARLCIKSNGLYERDEFEYKIPLYDAFALKNHALFSPVNKIRHYVDYAGHTFEIDEFCDVNYGLIIVEVELKGINEPCELPHWVGEDVTHLEKYCNCNIAQNPYNQW